MSVVSVKFLRTEAGVHTAAPTDGFLSTDCTDETGSKKKYFNYVLVHWDGAAWVEDPTYTIGISKAVLKVFNPCDGTFSYITEPIGPDFILYQECCIPQLLSAILGTQENYVTPGDLSVNVGLGCEEAAVINESIIVNAGASFDEFMNNLIAYLNSNYPEVGTFKLDPDNVGGVLLYTNNSSIFICDTPTFALNLLAP